MACIPHPCALGSRGVQLVIDWFPPVIITGLSFFLFFFFTSKGGGAERNFPPNYYQIPLSWDRSLLLLLPFIWIGHCHQENQC